MASGPISAPPNAVNSTVFNYILKVTTNYADSLRIQVKDLRAERDTLSRQLAIDRSFNSKVEDMWAEDRRKLLNQLREARNELHKCFMRISPSAEEMNVGDVEEEEETED